MRSVARLVALLAVFLVVSAVTSDRVAGGARTTALPPSGPPPKVGLVVRVVDGDTIRVRIGERVENVRYIGVNAPEVHHPQKGEEPGGREAMAVNIRLVGGKSVRLELDIRSRDRYGRLLAYVWVGETMINAELVRQGYAQVMTVPPNVRYQELFLKLQRDARQAGRGLWKRA